MNKRDALNNLKALLDASGQAALERLEERDGFEATAAQAARTGRMLLRKFRLDPRSPLSKKVLTSIVGALEA